MDDTDDLPTSSSHRQPLIASHSDAGEARKPGLSPSKDRPAASPRASSAAAAAAANEAEEDTPASAGVTASLIGKHASSHASLDSYDRTKNPFFAD